MGNDKNSNKETSPVKDRMSGNIKMGVIAIAIAGITAAILVYIWFAIYFDPIGVKINPEELVLAPGVTAEVQATAYHTKPDTPGGDKVWDEKKIESGADFDWNIDKTDIVTISKTSKTTADITGLKKGDVVVTATAKLNGKKVGEEKAVVYVKEVTKVEILHPPTGCISQQGRIPKGILLSGSALALKSLPPQRTQTTRS